MQYSHSNKAPEEKIREEEKVLKKKIMGREEKKLVVGVIKAI